MAEAKLRADLQTASAEITRLKQRLSPGVRAVHMNLSLIYQVPKGSGAENSLPLDEFLSFIERDSTIGR